MRSLALGLSLAPSLAAAQPGVTEPSAQPAFAPHFYAAARVGEGMLTGQADLIDGPALELEIGRWLTPALAVGVAGGYTTAPDGVVDEDFGYTDEYLRNRLVDITARATYYIGEDRMFLVGGGLGWQGNRLVEHCVALHLPET